MTAARRAEGILFLMTAIWGTTFALGKIVLQEISPLQLIAARFTVSALLLGMVFRRSIFPLKRPQLLSGGLLGLFLFLGFAVQSVGLGITTASKSGFLTSLSVVFVPLLQVVWERKSPHWGNVAGILVVAWGLWLLTSPEGSAFNTGDFLTLLCAIFFSVYIIYLDMISGVGSPLQLTFVQLAVNAVLSIGSSMVLERPVWSVSAGGVAIVVYLTIFATVLTTLGQTWFQKDTTPTRAAIIFSGEPVFAAIFAALIIDERLGSMGIVGGALILGGILISELSGEIPLFNQPVLKLEPRRRGAAP
jgi:drug/metabolite transporter (DMT)-like permease